MKTKHTHAFDMEKLQTPYMDFNTVNAVNAQNTMCLSLKALIQLMAAAVAERDMAYFTAGNKELAKELQSMHEALTRNNVTVGKYI